MCLKNQDSQLREKYLAQEVKIPADNQNTTFAIKIIQFVSQCDKMSLIFLSQNIVVG